jgi:hypothetical protein
MNQGLSSALPILILIQSIGAAIALTPFFFLSGVRFRSLPGALAIIGAALTAYSPLLHVAGILSLGSGLPAPYVGFAFYLIGILCFVAAVILTRRWRTVASLATLGACAAWTFFILRAMASGF